MVGVALVVGVGVALVGEGVGVGDLLQPLKIKVKAIAEAAKTAEIPDFFILQIYPVYVEVEKERAM